MRPLLEEVFCWTHSVEGRASTCLSLLRDRPYRRLFKDSSPTSVRQKPWRSPLTGLRLELPDFLVPLHDIILTAGVQTRFLASLPQCRFTVQLLTHSALRQMQCMRAGVSICRDEPSACMVPLETGRKVSLSAVEDVAWAPTMAWNAPAVQHVLAVTRTGIKERQDAVNAMLAELSESRAADEAGVALERVQKLHEYQRLAQLQEQHQSQQKHAERLQRAAELQKLQSAAEQHHAQAQVRHTQVVCACPRLRLF